MSLLLITNPPSELTVSTNWGTLVERSGKNMLGFGLNLPLFTLNYWDSSTTKPTVAKGSIVEVGGSLYQADSDTALTDEGGLADGVCHIKLVPAGDGSYVTPTLTNDSIPAWDADKFGWYDGTDKFLPYEMTQGGTGTTWSDKLEYVDQANEISRMADGTVISADTINEKTTDNGVTIDGVNIKDGYLDAVKTSEGGVNRNILIEPFVYSASSVTSGTIYAAISAKFPTIDQKIKVSGTIGTSGSMFIVAYAARYSSTSIRFYGRPDSSPSLDNRQVSDGGTFTYDGITIAI